MTSLKTNINLARIEYLKAFLDYGPNNAISRGKKNLTAIPQKAAQRNTAQADACYCLSATTLPQSCTEGRFVDGDSS